MPTEVLEAPNPTLPLIEEAREATPNSLEALLDYAHRHFSINSLSELSFTHSANSQAELTEALSNRDIMVIELDIDFYGGRPMCYHAGQHDKPIPLSEALLQVKQSNKILKLDFKRRNGIEPILKLLAESNLSQTVILNADIVNGHTIDFKLFEWGAKVRPQRFFQAARSLYPEGILSLSWSTVARKNDPLSAKNIDDMIAATAGMENIIFPVRADMAEGSWPELQRLLTAGGKRTVGFWNNSSQPVSKRFIEWARAEVGPDAIYALVDGHNNPLSLAEGLDHESSEARHLRIGTLASGIAVGRSLEVPR